MDGLHFIRPYWFMALLPAAVMLFLLFKNRHAASPWRAVVDAHLLRHLLIGHEERRSWSPLLLLGLLWLLLVVALAGPVWQRVPAVEFRPQVPPLMILLDLSRSMNVRDVAPSRIVQARSKLRTLLERLPQRPVAMSVYSLRGHAVMPFTEDRKLIQETLESLSPELMPVQGSRASAGLRFAGDQLQAYGARSGDLLLVSDAADAAASDIARELAGSGYRVSVFGIGTVGGGKIPDDRRGYLHADGRVVSTALDAAALQQVATQGGGYFTLVTRDNHDVLSLIEAFTHREMDVTVRQSETRGRVWREGGPWLILLALPLFLVIARPGAMLSILLFIMLPLPQPAQASAWNRLWMNQDQLGLAAFEAGDYSRAESVFDDPLWRGIAQYRSGQYQKALNSFSRLTSPIAHYNRGNTLVRLGRFDQALEAYRETLRLTPAHAGASFNMRLVEEVIRKRSKTSASTDKADDRTGEQPDEKGNKRSATSAAELLDAPTERDRQTKLNRSTGKPRSAGTAGGGAMLIEGGNHAGSEQSSTVGEGLTRDGVPGGEQDRMARQGEGVGGAQSEVSKEILPSQALKSKRDDGRVRASDKHAPQHASSAGRSNNSGHGEGRTGSAPSTVDKTAKNSGEPAGSPDATAMQTDQRTTGDSGESDSANRSSGDDGDDERRSPGSLGDGSGDNATAAEADATYRSMRNWVDSIVDDPAGLLKEKFRRDYQRAPVAAQGEAPW